MGYRSGQTTPKAITPDFQLPLRRASVPNGQATASCVIAERSGVFSQRTRCVVVISAL